MLDSKTSQDGPVNLRQIDARPINWGGLQAELSHDASRVIQKWIFVHARYFENGETCIQFMWESLRWCCVRKA